VTAPKRYTVRHLPGYGWAVFDRGVQVGTSRGPFWPRRGKAAAEADRLNAASVEGGAS